MPSITIDDLINSLEELKKTHGGDKDVTVWEYCGGDDDYALCSVTPVFDPNFDVIVLDTTYHYSGIRR